MDDKKRRYCVSIYEWSREDISGGFYDEDEVKDYQDLISKVLMEVSGDFGEFCRQARATWQEYAASEDEIEDKAENRLLQIQDDSEEADLFLNCDRFIPVLRLLCVTGEAFEAAFKEISHNGKVYTDISDIEVSSDGSRYPVSFFAKKDGGDRLLYFCDGEDLTGVGEEIPIRCTRKEDRVYVRVEPVQDLSWQDLYDSGEYSFEEIDEKLAKNPKMEWVHLKAEGEDVTFRIGDYKKITKDAEQVIFYDTVQGEAIPKVVFQMTGGKYLYQPESEAGSSFSTVIFTPPPTPADRIDPDCARGLLKDYLCAFYDAFSGVKEYREEIGGKLYVFQSKEENAPATYRDEEDEHRQAPAHRMFQTEIDGFILTGELALPMRAYEHHFSDSGDYDSYVDILCDTYDMEHSRYIRNLESVSFVAGSKRFTITLSGASASDSEDGSTDDLEALWSEFFGNSSPTTVRVENTETGEKRLLGTFDSLREQGVFLNADLPDIFCFDRKISSFAENIENYRKMKKALIDYISDKRSVTADRISRKEMRERLYPDGDGWEPDDNVVSFAAEMYNYYKAESEEKDGDEIAEIPNIAIIGEAGTGKSSLAEKLGKMFDNRKILARGPSNLKGAFLGQTKNTTETLLIEAAVGKKIIFIDEAYDLMSDDYGREAVAVLLPFMTGDRTDLATSMVESHTFSLENGETIELARHDKVSVDFIAGELRKNGKSVKIPCGIPPIWIGGYEAEIRLLLRENQGLYRRFKKCQLQKPRTDQLYSAFQRQFEKMERKTDPEIYKTLKDSFQKSRKSVEEFFRWGSQPQFSKYFGNYAQVTNFLKRCRDWEIKTDSDIEKVIESIKDDIERQSHTVRLKGNKGGNALDAFEQIQIIVDNKTRFTDIAGSGYVKDKDGDKVLIENGQFKEQIGYMERIIRMLVDRESYEKRGITIPRGVLMEGPPGAGKTFLARAMAGELEAAFIRKNPTKRVGFMVLSAAELTARNSAFIGSIFDSAREYDACVMFIDEVDAIAKKRDENEHPDHLLEMLRQMDGITGRSNIFVLAATNAPESLDKAFTRAGRIDNKLYFELPDRHTRRQMAEIHIKKRPLAHIRYENYEEGVGRLADEVAGRTRGETPGTIENIVNAAFIKYYEELSADGAEPAEKKGTIRQKLEPDTEKYGHSELHYLSCYLDEAIEACTVGERRAIKDKGRFSAKKNDGSCSAVAVHEVGHALATLLCGKSIQKITILARNTEAGVAGGYVMPEGDPKTKADYENRIRFMMGGRIAEEIVYGEDEISAGACADMRNATDLAYWMVESVGFSDEFGFMALAGNTSRYLPGQRAHTCSEAFREESDRAVREFLKKLYRETKGMLSGKKELILALAEDVFYKEEMTDMGFKKSYREQEKKLREEKEKKEKNI